MSNGGVNGEADPMQLADRLSQAAISDGDNTALERAQQPWLAAETPQQALDIIVNILKCRPDMRMTGVLVHYAPLHIPCTFMCTCQTLSCVWSAMESVVCGTEHHVYVQLASVNQVGDVPLRMSMQSIVGLKACGALFSTSTVKPC